MEQKRLMKTCNQVSVHPAGQDEEIISASAPGLGPLVAILAAVAIQTNN